MANYDLYKNIDPGSITSATSSLRQKLQTNQTKLQSFDSSLTDSMWKAACKATLKEAFGKIDGEVYSDLMAGLNNLDTAAGLIQQYNDAKNDALTYKGYINNATDETSESEINSWRLKLEAKEKIMEECESKVNALK